MKSLDKKLNLPQITTDKTKFQRRWPGCYAKLQKWNIISKAYKVRLVWDHDYLIWRAVDLV